MEQRIDIYMNDGARNKYSNKIYRNREVQSDK